MNKKMPIDKREFTYEILLSKGLGKLTRKAEKLLILLADNAINKSRHRITNEDDLHDCLQTSKLNIFKNWYKFNPDVTNNAFAYYTELHKRSIPEFINELYSLRGIKTKEEQKSMQMISINNTNNGQGLYNI